MKANQLLISPPATLAPVTTATNTRYRRDFSKLIWQLASPKCDFDQTAPWL